MEVEAAPYLRIFPPYEILYAADLTVEAENARYLLSPPPSAPGADTDLGWANQVQLP